MQAVMLYSHASYDVEQQVHGNEHGQWSTDSDGLISTHPQLYHLEILEQIECTLRTSQFLEALIDEPPRFHFNIIDLHTELRHAILPSNYVALIKNVKAQGQQGDG